MNYLNINSIIKYFRYGESCSTYHDLGEEISLIFVYLEVLKIHNEMCVSVCACLHVWVCVLTKYKSFSLF